MATTEKLTPEISWKGAPQFITIFCTLTSNAGTHYEQALYQNDMFNLGLDVKAFIVPVESSRRLEFFHCGVHLIASSVVWK